MDPGQVATATVDVHDLLIRKTKSPAPSEDLSIPSRNRTTAAGNCQGQNCCSDSHIEAVNRNPGKTVMTPTPRDNRMILALDLDGTIDELPAFFSHLTAHWASKVFIVTYRLDQDHAEEYARRLGIRFDELILASSHQDKGRILREIGARVFIEDSDEAISSVPKEILVLKVRHLDNYDFIQNEWL